MGSGWRPKTPVCPTLAHNGPRTNPGPSSPPSSGISHPATHPIPSPWESLEWLLTTGRSHLSCPPAREGGCPEVLMPQWLNSDSQRAAPMPQCCLGRAVPCLPRLSCAVQISKAVKRVDMIRAELSEVLWGTKQGLACCPANNAREGNPLARGVRGLPCSSANYL